MQGDPDDTATTAAASPTVSAVVCAYTEQRLDDLRAAVASLEAQTHPLHELLVVIDHAPALLELARAAFPGARVLPNDGPRGLSGARNAGVAAASGDVVAFLDDDARAAPTWLAEALPAFADADVAGVGTAIVPAWDLGRPGWFPDEFLWVVGCDYRGLPERGEIRNPIGASMLVRRAAIDEVGGFRTGIGRTAATLDGCEETELAIRIRQARPGARFVRVPEAVVAHRVVAARHRPSYFVRRAWAEGVSKRRLVRRIGAADGTSAERSHAIRLLVRGVPRELAAILRGDLAGPLRAVALVVGLGVTTAGYLAGGRGAA